MEMSADYMRQTAEHMAAKGYALEVERDEKERDGQRIFVRDRYALTRNDNEHFILECITYPDGQEKYFIEVKRYHSIYTFSFPLDSWKHRPDRVEFKYYALPETGLGLSFILNFPKEDD